MYTFNVCYSSKDLSSMQCFDHLESSCILFIFLRAEALVKHIFPDMKAEEVAQILRLRLRNFDDSLDLLQSADVEAVLESSDVKELEKVRAEMQQQVDEDEGLREAVKKAFEIWHFAEADRFSEIRCLPQLPQENPETQSSRMEQRCRAVVASSRCTFV